MPAGFGKTAKANSFHQGKGLLRAYSKILREGIEITTGIDAIDRKVGRLRQGDLVLVAGPAHGFKTQTMIEMVLNNPEVNFLWASPDEGAEFVYQKFLCAIYGLTSAEFDEAIMEDPSVFDEDIADIESHVVVTSVDRPDKLTQVAQQADAQLGQLHVLVFDYVESLEMGQGIPPKIAWLKRFGRENGLLIMAIHQSRKEGLDLSIRPHMGMLQEAGHKEAFLILWSKRPYIDPEDDFAIAQDENQPSIEVYVLKNKRGRTYIKPIILAIEDGNRVVGWTKAHTKRQRGV